MQEDNRPMTPKEAADYLRISKVYLHFLKSNGVIGYGIINAFPKSEKVLQTGRGLNKPKGKVVYFKGDLDEYLHSIRVSPKKSKHSTSHISNSNSNGKAAQL